MHACAYSYPFIQVMSHRKIRSPDAYQQDMPYILPRGRDRGALGVVVVRRLASRSLGSERLGHSLHPKAKAVGSNPTKGIDHGDIN